jgi:predicted O-methyltransferase YrrM
VEQRFVENIRFYILRSRVSIRTGLSVEKLVRILGDPWQPHLDIVFVDGSHEASDVLQDIVLSWRLLKPRGIIIMDDYEWGLDRPLIERPKPAIDAFLKCYEGQYEVLQKEYQVIVRKLL